MTDHERFVRKKGYVTDTNLLGHYEEEADTTFVDANKWKDTRDGHYEKAELLGVRSSDIPLISSSESSTDPRGESSASGARRATDAQYHRERRRERRRQNQ